MIYYVATLERNNFVPTLYRIPVLGGTPAKVLDRVFSAVAFSQDGKQFAFVRKNQDDVALMVANSDGTGEARTIAISKQPAAFPLLDRRGLLMESESLAACLMEQAPATRRLWKFPSKVENLSRSALKNGRA